MEQFKRAQCILLDTEQKSIITLKNHSTLIITPNTISKLLEDSNCGWTNQHLYIISDDKIEDGDYWINLDNNTINNNVGIANFANNAPSCKKIIATTDTSLVLYDEAKFIKNSPTVILLPQPSQQFIQKYIESYNKGEDITDVLIEYENKYEGKEYVDDQDAYGYDKFGQILKVNPKDNTITIRRLKDSWNREEVIELIKQYSLEMAAEITNFHKDKWIKNNL